MNTAQLKGVLVALYKHCTASNEGLSFLAECNLHMERHACVIHTVGIGSYPFGHPFGSIRPSRISRKAQVFEFRLIRFVGLRQGETVMMNFTDNDEQCGEVFMLFHVPDALPDCSVSVSALTVVCAKLQLNCHTKILIVLELDVNKRVYIAISESILNTPDFGFPTITSIMVEYLFHGILSVPLESIPLPIITC